MTNFPIKIDSSGAILLSSLTNTSLIHREVVNSAGKGGIINSIPIFYIKSGLWKRKKNYFNYKKNSATNGLKSPPI
jgi:hypothetical protein